MPRRKSRLDNVEAARLETLLGLHIGALLEIRYEIREMKGGWPARVREILERHLGPDAAERDRKPCP